VSNVESSQFQEQWLLWGLDLIPEGKDIPPALDTTIGYTLVLGCELFRELEMRDEEVRISCLVSCQPNTDVFHRTLS